MQSCHRRDSSAKPRNSLYDQSDLCSILSLSVYVLNSCSQWTHSVNTYTMRCTWHTYQCKFITDVFFICSRNSSGSQSIIGIAFIACNSSLAFFSCRLIATHRLFSSCSCCFITLPYNSIFSSRVRGWPWSSSPSPSFHQPSVIFSRCCRFCKFDRWHKDCTQRWGHKGKYNNNQHLGISQQT